MFILIVKFLKFLFQVSKIFSSFSNSNIQKNNLMINDKAKNIQKSADKVSNNILLSLFTIPVTLLIALIFIYLITKPLRRLIEKIQSLEQGNFEQTIND